MQESGSQSSASMHSPDLDKLQAIWKNIRRQEEQRRQQEQSHHRQDQSHRRREETNLISSGQSVQSSVKRAILTEEQKTLQARLRLTQKQLSKARQNTALLMRKLSDAETRIESMQMEQNRVKHKQNSLDHPREEETRRVLQERLQEKQKQVDRLTLRVKSQEIERRELEEGLLRLQSQNQLWQRRAQLSHQTIEGESTGAQLLQLQQAHKSIDRLTQLLRTHPEHKQFAQTEDFKQMLFMGRNTSRISESRTSKSPLRVSSERGHSNCVPRTDQKSLWTPAACYKVLLMMKLKHRQLSEECIEETLRLLNQVWIQRQSAVEMRLKKAHQQELCKMKKKSQIPYDEMVARKQIQRLKKQLSVNTQLNTNSQLSTLKSVGQYQDQLKNKEREVLLLQERISLLQAESSGSDRVYYLEGALWIANKIGEEVGVAQEDIRALETQHHRTESRRNQTHCQHIFQDVHQIIGSVSDKLQQMKSSIQGKMQQTNQ